VNKYWLIFYEDPISSFYVKLLIQDRQIDNKQTPGNSNFLSGDNETNFKNKVI